MKSRIKLIEVFFTAFAAVLIYLALTSDNMPFKEYYTEDYLRACIHSNLYVSFLQIFVANYVKNSCTTLRIPSKFLCNPGGRPSPGEKFDCASDAQFLCGIALTISAA